MAKQNKWPRMTRQFEVLWPHLDKEEEYQGKPSGRFSVCGKLPLEATNAFLAELEAVYESFKKQGYFKEFSPKRGSSPSFGDREDKNGEISFKFTTNSKWPSGDPKTVPVFDAKGKPYTGPIGNGSVAQICFSITPKTISTTNYGCSLRLEAIQIIELKQYNPGTADMGAYGFEATEGFESVEAPEPDAQEFGFGGETQAPPEEAPF